jgi:hypothetical protein
MKDKFGDGVPNLVNGNLKDAARWLPVAELIRSHFIEHLVGAMGEVGQLAGNGHRTH